MSADIYLRFARTSMSADIDLCLIFLTNPSAAWPSNTVVGGHVAGCVRWAPVLRARAPASAAGSATPTRLNHLQANRGVRCPVRQQFALILKLKRTIGSIRTRAKCGGRCHPLERLCRSPRRCRTRLRSWMTAPWDEARTANGGKCEGRRRVDHVKSSEVEATPRSLPRRPALPPRWNQRAVCSGGYSSNSRSLGL